jgi:hypothetical protein
MPRNCAKLSQNATRVDRAIMGLTAIASRDMAARRGDDTPPSV